MSLIFDALQRSEAERSSVDVSALPTATEVLQFAEVRAVSERRAATHFERLGETQSAERDGALLLQSVPPVTAAVESPEAAEFSLNDSHLDVFGQFKPLQVSVL